MALVPIHANGPPAECHESIAHDLQGQGWAIVPDFLPPMVVGQLRNELLLKWQQGEFRTAAVGRGADRVVNSGIRNDQVKWLEALEPSTAQYQYWQAMEALRVFLNRALYLGLAEYEAHFSLYEPGTYYRRHLDQFRGIGLREVTAILYLNDNWLENDGGELLLYENMESPEAFKQVSPVGGQLVVFMSGEFPHEVLPASRRRMSLTGWYKKRDSGY